MKKGRQSVADDLTQSAAQSVLSVNWKLLDRHSGAPPCLLWPSVLHAAQVAESDSRSIPSLQHIELRNRANSEAGERDQWLACKEFWDAFRRSRLVIVFDRHLNTQFLRRLRDEVKPNLTLALETLIVFAGKDNKVRCERIMDDIRNALATRSTRIQLHYQSDMISTAAPFPHDRFAVTDGEFWHFGGSAGGYERCLTAVSRGWKAKEVGVAAFVEAVWAEMAQQGSRS